jgi:hypothetical protein
MVAEDKKILPRFLIIFIGLIEPVFLLYKNTKKAVTRLGFPPLHFALYTSSSAAPPHTVPGVPTRARLRVVLFVSE